MDKSKVYIGVYKDSVQESLFYQKDSSTYYDLKQKKKVSSTEIEESSLIPYNDIIRCKSRFKINIIRLYDLDRMQRIALNRLYIGNIYQIVQIEDRKYFGDSPLNIGTETHVQGKLLIENRLLNSTSQYLDNADFIDIENSDFYKNPYYPEVGDIYIDTDKLKPAFVELGINTLQIEKGKLLEKYREYKRR